jgi:hypothetical protein
MRVPTLLHRLGATGFVRRTADAAFGHWARHRAGQLERCSTMTAQCHLLLRLVRRAANTRFGLDHDFASIRTVRDYQDRVPLRDYEAFWTEYWEPAFPMLGGVTWPTAIPYLAMSSGTTTGRTKYIPVSREMLAANRLGALTSLAWLRTAHPETRLFTGRMFFLGGSSDLQEIGVRGQGSGVRDKLSSLTPHPSPLTPISVLAGDLSGIVAREVPSLFRPFTYPPLEIALDRDWDHKLQLVAEQSARLPITLLSGVPSWMLALFERLKQVTGRDRIADVWPTLQVVVHGGARFDPYAELFRREIGSDTVRFLDVYAASEGFIAATDPRFGLLRLIPDQGLFFEFVPVEELKSDRPTRHTCGDVVPGVQYAVVLTSCAGLWSYVIGDTVCFEKRDPPLLRFTGRTHYYLSAFGEHVISEEVERAVTAAALATGATSSDFHVGPVFPESPGHPGRHRYLIEFVERPTEMAAFIRVLDETLCRLNEDYQAHREGGLALGPPEVWPLPRGSFHDWMRCRGRLGGQNKVPRMDNTGSVTRDLEGWLQANASTLALDLVDDGSHGGDRFVRPSFMGPG